MNKAFAVIVGLVVLLMLVVFSSTYTVKYNQVAIKATFGRADEGSIITEPGLHYRLPVFIDRVTTLDTRLQLAESGVEEFETDDGLQIAVRAFLLWKVDTAGDGPLRFYKSYRELEDALDLLQIEFRTQFQGVLSTYAFDDLIGETSQLADAEESIRAALAASLASRGIVPVTVGISQLVLPPKTSQAVLSRMQATRNVLAGAERNAGTAAAERIRSEGNTMADKIRAFANQRAEEIRAEGQRDAKRYLEQMAQDEDLAIFLVWLDALERMLAHNSTVILPAEGFAPLHLMRPDSVEFRNAIPVPSADGTAPAPKTAPDAVPSGTTAAADVDDDDLSARPTEAPER
ncbi:MAG: hypothetical protein GY715_16050 [Planctomycetes bacterium]|nr:hypothetical protein [Planctomycetota bacterium]